VRGTDREFTATLVGLAPIGSLSARISTPRPGTCGA
jgi:hypothetical protein